MLQYDHARTNSIVDRLTLIWKTVQWLSAFVSALVLGGFSALVLANLWHEGAAVLGFLFGGAIGFFVGKTLAGFIVVYIEWCAQVLVAQGEIIAAAKRSDSSS